MENWRVHPIHADYEVSDLGRVRRCTPKRGTRVGRLKVSAVNREGYEVVTLGRSKTVRVHVLVLEAFIGPRPDRHDGCHGDGVRTNNLLANLRWATRKENMQDAVRHGTAKINADKVRAYWLNPDNRQAQSQRVTQYFADNPEKWAADAVKRKAAQARPEVREKMRAAKLGKKQDPEAVKRRIAAVIASRTANRQQRLAGN